MECIRDKSGVAIKKSRNLRGILEYVSNHIIAKIALDRLGSHEGRLSILFDDESSYETNFASYDVLREFVRNWRNVYGAPLMMNGTDCDVVSFRNPALV